MYGIYKTRSKVLVRGKIIKTNIWSIGKRFSWGTFPIRAHSYIISGLHLPFDAVHPI